ncbi:sigma factor-like helix-turn-helix DNA-binding protein [Lachnospiraceae bacterium 48-21]
MRGRKPKERDSYVLRMGDGTLVEVSREVYLEWYQSRRRERYQKEKDRKRGVYSLDELEEKGSSQGMPFLVRDGVEETALRNICRDNVQKALGKLPDADAGLMELLYFNGVTVTDAAEIYGCSRKTIQNRRKRILGELCQLLREQGIQGGYF